MDEEHEEKRPANAAAAAAAAEPSSSVNETDENKAGEAEESLEEMARKALECPCVSELRDGPCGKEFSEAFVCYVTSTAEEKGSDCVAPFLAMQACMEASPEHFTEAESADEDTDHHKMDLPRERRRSKSKTPSPSPPS